MEDIRKDTDTSGENKRRGGGVVSDKRDGRDYICSHWVENGLLT